MQNRMFRRWRPMANSLVDLASDQNLRGRRYSLIMLSLLLEMTLWPTTVTISLLCTYVFCLDAGPLLVASLVLTGRQELYVVFGRTSCTWMCRLYYRNPTPGIDDLTLGSTSSLRNSQPSVGQSDFSNPGRTSESCISGAFRASFAELFADSFLPSRLVICVNRYFSYVNSRSPLRNPFFATLTAIVGFPPYVKEPIPRFLPVISTSRKAWWCSQEMLWKSLGQRRQ